MPSFADLHFETPRLVLRPFRHADAADLFVVFSDPEVFRHIPIGDWKHIDESHQRIARDINSMAAGEYISMQSQRELFQNQISIEREEMRVMPDVEEEELSAIYQAKGLTEADSDRIARRSSLTINPDPPRWCSARHRGHDKGASVQLVTTTSASR